MVLLNLLIVAYCEANQDIIIIYYFEVLKFLFRAGKFWGSRFPWAVVSRSAGSSANLQLDNVEDTASAPIDAADTGADDAADNVGDDADNDVDES